MDQQDRNRRRSSTPLLGRYPPIELSGIAFRISWSGEAVTKEVYGAKQEIAIFLESAEAVFYAGEALDLGNQQAKCLNIRAPIEYGMVGKIP
jgi:hypothetical protein